MRCREKIIIVKFGYNIIRHTFEKIIEMNKNFNVQLIVLDTEQNRKIFTGIIDNVHYIPTVKLKSKVRYIIDKIRFIESVMKKILQEKPDIILVHIFKGDLLLPILLPFNRYVFQFYHFEVGRNIVKRYTNNIRKFLDIMIYKNVVYNHDVMPQWILKLKKNIKYIPGSYSKLSSTSKDFYSLNLLYIGTLSNRNIHETIEGFSLFVKNHPSLKATYHIIGDGKPEFKNMVLEKIEEHKLENIVIYHGRLSDDEISYYFDICNIGISYVPITSYFTNNIPTKTYEYLLSGMAVVATETKANKDIIDQNNGVLIQDNPKSFYEGLNEMYHNMDKYDSNIIKSKVDNYTVENVIKKHYVPYFSALIGK